MSVKELLKIEIEKLPDNLAPEVYNFIIFLESQKDKQELARSVQALSEVSFEKIWDNEEDALYDKL